MSSIELKLGSWIRQEKLSLSKQSIKELARDKTFFKLIRHCLKPFSGTSNMLFSNRSKHVRAFTVTPVYLWNAFLRGVAFSAAPGDEEIYGVKKSNKTVYSHPTFLAHTIHQVVAPNNKQMLLFPFLNSPSDFFEAIYKQDRSIYSHLGKIIDVGGDVQFYHVRNRRSFL